jgi:hypothetical protein
MKKKNRLILEFTEFNLQRLNPDSVQPSIHVDDRQLSLNAFDKHQDSIRQAISRINGILHNISGTNAYKNLRSKLTLEDQDIKSMKILKILKSNKINYDVYISFIIGDKEYWGVVKDIMNNPNFQSEVFKDYNLYQSKEWIIKIKGLVIKIIKNWLKPEPGIYKLLNNEVICYSNDTNKQLIIKKGTNIEVIRSYDNRIIIKHGSKCYNLVGDNYVYFNWWFDKI